MKKGPCNTYLNDRLANLLGAHGPECEEGNRALADKMNYIIPAWDAILRDEARKWREHLTREEFSVIVECCWGHAFSMEAGGPYDIDQMAVEACLADSMASELCSVKNPGEALSGALEKVRATCTQSVAADYALVWMVIRERKRMGEK